MSPEMTGWKIKSTCDRSTQAGDVVGTRTGVDLSPDIIQTDYEAAVISAISDVFPASSVRGCFFHYAQALWRQVMDRGLARDYTDNPAVQTHIRRTAALPLLPLAEVHDAWIEVMEQGPYGQQIRWVQRLRHQHFVKELKKIETADRRPRRQIGQGGAMRPRARVDRDRDARIERLKQQLAVGRRSVIQFLDAVGHFIKLQ
ncbi:uncharacterized protein LOC124142514 [Haliotis rufescens]|uniref:uncharacterized protein LOC124142514 n=1 Tax=Haliotis rufescens TaxID=6454 RepID=UPI00201E9EF6|nr:uncharacterized protein LOC124142514 [Haliotis rufescens]